MPRTYEADWTWWRFAWRNIVLSIVNERVELEDGVVAMKKEVFSHSYFPCFPSLKFWNFFALSFFPLSFEEVGLQRGFAGPVIILAISAAEVMLSCILGDLTRSPERRHLLRVGCWESLRGASSVSGPELYYFEAEVGLEIHLFQLSYRDILDGKRPGATRLIRG